MLWVYRSQFWIDTKKLLLKSWLTKARVKFQALNFVRECDRMTDDQWLNHIWLLRLHSTTSLGRKSYRRIWEIKLKFDTNPTYWVVRYSVQHSHKDVPFKVRRMPMNQEEIAEKYEKSNMQILVVKIRNPEQWQDKRCLRQFF